MKAKFKLEKWLGITLIVLITSCAQAQYCDSITPVFYVDLSTSPNMTWVSPDTDRDGYCCGASGADKCLEFIITLHPNSASLVFSIASGAVPPGALYYQIDCGPPTPVGSPICLTGTGPFHLTFCKPGNNTNAFSIVTIPNPIFGPDLNLGDGCSDNLWAQFYDEATVTWTSISPGPPGMYNALLSCTSGCDTVAVNAEGGPPTILYQVCGLAENGCIVEPICDTMSVSIDPPLTPSIVATDTVLCNNELTVPASVLITGGTAPYSISWSNGTTGNSTNLGPGTHVVSVTDANNCAVRTDTVNITLFPQAIVNAGPDQIVCADNSGAVALAGTFSNTTGILWSGGLGTFIPNETTPNAIYQPTEAEIASGVITLTMTSNDLTGCLPVSDDLTITFQTVLQQVTISTTNVSCNGLSDGTAVVTVVGPNGPYTYSFDGNNPTGVNSVTGLSSGTHSVTINSLNGCDTTLTFTISEPAPLTILISNQTDVGCSGDNTGSAAVNVTGGTMPYTITWSTLPAQSGLNAVSLSAGNYTATVTDVNGCNANSNVLITEPDPLTLSFSIVPPSCFGMSNGAVTANVAGGTSPYNFLWSNGSSGTSLYNVGAGLVDLTIIDANGCSVTSNENVYEPTQLTLVVSPDTIVCPGTEVVVTAMATGGTGSYTYNWQPFQGDSSSITINPQAEEIVNCSVTDNNGCSASESANISLFSLNPSDIQASIVQDSICANDSTQIDAIYTGSDPTVELSWTFCPSCPVQTTVAPLTNQTYTIIATNQCNQQISDDVSVTVIPSPVVELDPILASVCPNEYFSVQNNATNDPDWDYFWNFGDGTTSTDQVGIHSYGSQGNYTVTLYVVNEFGCSSSDTASGQIIVNPQAEAQFSPTSFVESALDPEFTFINESINATQYEWQFGDGTSSTLENPLHTYQEWGTFIVTLNANNAFNCPGQYQQIVVVKPSFTFYLPNAFTPDGDQHNQVFIAKTWGIQEKGFHFEIYNRWGELIFETNDINVGWDGTYKGAEQAQDGVYIWKVNFRDLTDNKLELVGHVNLLK